MGYGRPQGQKTFSFGKHKGKTFEEVAADDKGYCQWVLTLQDASGLMKEFIDFVRARQDAGGESGQSIAQPGRPPSAAAVESRYFPGAPTAVQRLDDSMMFVCELLPHDLFLARIERAADAPGPPYQAGHAGASCYVPAPIWQMLSRLAPEASLTQDRRAWTFPLSRYGDVVRQLEVMGQVEPIPSWLIRWMDRAKSSDGDILQEAKVPDGLLPYQLEGLKFGLSRKGRCLIGDEMGLGKTLQALALAAQYQEDWPVLVICPATLRWVWKEQALLWLKKWITEDDIQIVKKGSEALRSDAKMWVLSYHMIATDFKRAKSLYQRKPDSNAHTFVICDESHNIKEWQAERTKAAVPILKNARRALLLSGTPTRNAADELHPQLCGLVPYCGVKLQDFRARYCVQRQRPIAGGRSILQVVGSRNGTELNLLLTSTIMVRRLKREVLSQLPDKRRKKVPLEVADNKVLKEIRQMWGPGGSSDDDLYDGSGGVQRAFEEIGMAKVGAVKEHLLEVLEGSSEKMIVFAHHRSMMDSLADLLTKKLGKDGLNYVRIDGSVPPDKRPPLVETFQTDERCRVALLSITACGEGLTLTAAGLVIFAELFWVPGAVEQAEARAHRLGSKHSKVIVEFLVVPNSPEDRIYDELERKVRETSTVLNGVQESMGAQECLSRKRQLDSKRLQDMFERAKKQKESSGDDERTKKQKESSEDDDLLIIERAPATPQAKSCETPPPVDRTKLEYLLRAARRGPVAMKMA
mmetsp:Transcript_60366/g.112011  ORF Transcript_60366/g.112011 Transcript_60366/m.112011 type:complete len:751 (+) Transcript_60366:73-2325(+)